MPDKKRVAVIDDEAAIGELVERILAREYDVEVYQEVESFFEGLEQGRHYDVILCDLYMEGISGPKIYEQLVERWPGQARAMIFMSGVSSAEIEASLPEKAPRNMIEKPFDIQGLRSAVHRVA